MAYFLTLAVSARPQHNFLLLYFFTFSAMFKGKIYLSRKEGDKEEKIEKEFDNKKEFDAFVEKNPDLKKLLGFKWEPISWSEPLLGIRKFFEDAERDQRKDMLSEMESDIRKLFDKTKKLLGK